MYNQLMSGSVNMKLFVTILCVSLTLVASQNDPNCGTKGPKAISSRIVGGENALPLEYPWQISLRTTNGIEWYHTCGGSLFLDQWVLTAAHCVDRTSDATKYVVRLGEHDRSKTEGTEVDATVERVIKHPSYSSSTIDYDVAILKLKAKLDLAGKHSHLGTVCLPSKAQENIEGKSCVSTGWGNTAWQGTSPNILQKVTVPIVAKQTCIDNYSGVNPVTPRMICSGVGGKGCCQGDSGGPLNCVVDAKWYTYGATSWGVKCADEGYPTVNARVSELETWIWENVKNFS